MSLHSGLMIPYSGATTVKPQPLFSLLASFLLASCASEKSEPRPSSAPRNLSTRLSESNGYKQDANGNWVPQNDRRSQFEGKGDSNFAGKSFNKKAYQAGDFEKKSWWGSKAYDRKAFAGNTDGSRFEKSSGLGAKGAREAGRAVSAPDSYSTASYATSKARETSTGGIRTPNDAQNQVDRRQGVFDQPEMIDWKEQRSLSLGQSKGILGR